MHANASIDPRRDRAFAFSGIGNPASFFEQMQREGIDLAGANIHADHYRYSQADILREEQCAAVSKADFLITTAKDAVKLSRLKFQLPCYVVEIDVEIDEADEFSRML